MRGICCICLLCGELQYLLELDVLIIGPRYHKVSQTSGDEGFACSVNYW